MKTPSYILATPWRGFATLAVVTLAVAACTPPARIEHPGESSDERQEDSEHHDHAERAAPPPSAALLAKAQRVRVLPNAEAGCVTEVIGLVDVHERAATSAQALEELRVKAATLGADAVVGVEFEHADGKAATHLSGMAVRCRDLLRGRPYDVIGVVEVPGDMGEEEQALRSLRERGRTVHADLLIDVSFVHGEGTAPTLLRATAIRIREGTRGTEATARRSQ
jgi:uncharacterized protein YbjQ (UPF0145 family)